ncbi:MAG: DUF5668 domain-containing protein [Ferruginibacter sp.]
MTDEEKRSRLNNRMGNNRAWSGFILLIIGGGLLLQRMGTPFPDWIFTWPVILIGIGVLLGIRKKFHGSGWIIMILVGGYFLMNDFFPQMQGRQYAGPVLLIALGITFILRPRQHPFGDRWGRWNDYRKDNGPDAGDSQSAYSSNEDFLDITSILGGTKKNILSKDFKGGDVTNFLGGSELNLSQANINGGVVMDITNVFGGTKLIVPSNWDVRSEIVSILGSVEDKRQLTGIIDTAKILVLKGTSIFGGIEIRSY